MTRHRYTDPAKQALEAALKTATGRRWAVVYHKGTARGWFDILPLRRDRRWDRHENRLLRGEELAQAQKATPWRLGMSPRQEAVLKALFGDYWHNSNVPGDQEWLTWAANGRQGPEPRKGARNWD